MKKLGLLMVVAATLSGCSLFNKKQPAEDNTPKQEEKIVSDDLLKVRPDLKEDYINPVSLPAAGGANEAADPFVYRFNGKYYLYMTTGGEKVRCYVSNDLLHWSAATNGPSPGLCYEGAAGNKIGSTPYAPEVIYYDGYFYMVTSPHGDGHYILKSESPEGPFQDITGNIGKSIDGSFFIDEDEQAYMFTAGGNAILGYKLDLNPDGITFEKNDDNSDWTMSYAATHLGAWNEGPYMLKRYGAYYLTHTGTHYLSPGYRVNYAYAPKGSDVSKSSSFTHIDNLNTLVATDDTFHALGHSSTVLGPDMDSYYIAYHSMKGTASFRYYNINRLSFNGGNMTINEYGELFNQSPSMPEYSAEDSSEMSRNGNKYFSNKEHNKDAFSAEFNVVGEGKMYFAYASDDNYGYLEFKNNKITLGKVSDGSNITIKTISLSHTYDTGVLHTYRINYGYGKAAIYFDSMEKEYDIDCEFQKGKIGVDAAFDEIEYCAFSNVGGGKSDKIEYNSKKILANAYSEELSILNGDKSGISYSTKGTMKIVDNGMMSLSKEGDRATYLMRQNEPGDYNLALRIPYTMLGKKVGIRLNDGQVKEVTIPNNAPKVKNGDVYLNITTLSLNYEEYWLSLVNIGDNVSFYEIDLEPVYQNEAYDFNLSSTYNNDGKFIARNNQNFSGNSLVTSSETDAFGFMSKAKFTDPEVSVKFKLTGMFEAIGFLGLMANVNNYNNSTNLEANPGYMEQGYMLKVEVDCIKLTYVDFNYSVDVATVNESVSSNVVHELRMKIENNHIVCYLDNNEIIDTYANIGRLSGQVGVLAYKVESQISHFSAE